MQINDVGMTRSHFQTGDSARVRMLVLHATAGRAPGDYNWLRQGGSSAAPVSIHYYIDKAGAISRMVADKDIAWHAGQSAWVVDGQQIPYSQGCNQVSVGIELENLNDGRDPYPQPQYEAALWLARTLVARYNIPRAQLVRHLDIAPGRKTDPRAFPWERFAAEVYQESSAVQKPAAEQPPAESPAPEPLPPARQLRQLLVDLAYRTAGTSCPAGWPLLGESVSRATGMPVVAITPPTEGETAPDTQQRAVSLAKQPLLVLEAYGRDLLYAPPDDLEHTARLSQTEPGLLRDVLLYALFRAVDPANGFQPHWAFHQFYSEHMADIGVPIGPNHRLDASISDGRRFVCQHFALDTLCSPVGEWRTVIRLSDLLRGMDADDSHKPWQRELRGILLNDLYQQRTGRSFDAQALFCQYATSNNLGAPLGKAEFLRVGGQQLVAMPFALDVIYCRVPEGKNWDSVTVNELPGILGEQEQQDEQRPAVARLSSLLQQGELDADLPAILGVADFTPRMPMLPVYRGAVLGAETSAPRSIDLAMYFDTGSARPGALNLVLICPTPGPASSTLLGLNQPAAPRWHYHIDRQGAIVRLVDAQHMARPAGAATTPGQAELDQRSLAVAIEGELEQLAPDQHAALLWLLRDIMQRHGLQRSQIMTSRCSLQRAAHQQPGPDAQRPAVAAQQQAAEAVLA